MSRDQFITEKIMNRCWHEYPTGGEVMIPGPNNCKKCHAREGLRNPNFSFSTSPDDILALQQFVMGAEWWGSFVWDAYLHKFQQVLPSDALSDYIKWLLSDPNLFADLVAEYRGWKP